MMTPLLLAVLAQAPVTSPAAPNDGIVVIVSQRTGITPERALQLAGDVSNALQKNGVRISRAPDAAASEIEPVMKDSTACEGKRQCLAKLGTLLGVRAIVALEVAEVLKDTAVHLELISTQDASRLAEHSLSVAARDKTPLSTQLKVFAAAVTAALPSPVATTPEPVVTQAPAPHEPAVAPEPKIVYVEKKPSAARAFAWVPLAVGAAGVAGGGAFLLAAGDRASTLNNGTHTISEAERIRDDGKRYQTIGAVSAGVGAALVATGVVMMLVGGDSADSGAPAVTPVATGDGAGVLLRGTWP